MRVLAVILAFIAAGLAALLVMNREEKVMRTVPVSANAAVDGFTLAKPIVIAVPERAQGEEPPVKEKEVRELNPRTIPLFKSAESKLPKPEDAICLRFGPIPEKNLKKLRTSIERIGWMDRVQIKAVDLAERIVYAGPYSTEVRLQRRLKSSFRKDCRMGSFLRLMGKAGE